MVREPALRILLLVGIAQDQGALDIDERASLCIPEWVGTESKAVTIRQLLNNTSGRASYDPYDDEWHGLVRGPLLLVIRIANDGLFCLPEDIEPRHRPAWMTNIARRVMPHRDAFEKWLETVLDLLGRYHPAASAKQESFPDDDFDLGRPVARELFDTTKPYQAADEARLIARFLQSVDPANPCLSPKENSEE